MLEQRSTINVKNTSSLKVLLTSDHFWPFIGGAEISSLIICSKLAQMGFNISVLTNRPPNTAAHQSYNNLKIYREKLFSGKGLNIVERIVFYLRAAILILKHARKEKPNIIFTQQLISIPTLLVSKIFQIPVVIMVRDYWPVCYYRSLLKPDGYICSTYDKCFRDMFTCARNSFRYRLKKKLRFMSTILALSYTLLMAMHTLFVKHIMMKANIIAISNFVKDILEINGFNPKKISVVYNPISIGAQGSSGDHYSSSIVFVGSLDFEKGLHNLIRAMPQVCNTIREAKLLIAGDGPQMTHFKTLAKNLGIENKCEFYGQISDDQKAKLYNSCGLVVVPSIWPEPFGRVVVEAMSFKRPVIASNIGGIPELVNEKTGVLVQPGDPRVLADAIISVLTNKGRFEFESNLERFSSEKLAKQYITIIKKIVKCYKKSWN